MRSIHINPLARAVGVFGAVAALAGGATFAVLQDNTATLTQNTISTNGNDSGLVVDGPDTNSEYSDSEPGFTFANLEEGGDFSPEQDFDLRNLGDEPLYVTVRATGGVESGDLDPTKIVVNFENNSTGEDQQYTLAQLQSAARNLPGVTEDDSDNLQADETNDFDIKVQLLEGAVSGDSASFSGFNLVFTGTEVDEEE